MKSNLSDEEYTLFTLKLQRRFNEEIKSNVKGRINIITTQSPEYSKIFQGYIIKPVIAKDLPKYQTDFLAIDNINEIILSTPNSTNIPYHLYRHMRNSIAHSWITKSDAYYEFIDYANERDNIISMVCRLEIKKWENLMDDIYNVSKSFHPTSNIPIQGQINLSLSSNNNIVTKEKIQL